MCKTDDASLYADSEVLSEMLVVGYKVPLIEVDNTTSGRTITAAEISGLIRLCRVGPTLDLGQIFPGGVGSALTYGLPLLSMCPDLLTTFPTETIFSEQFQAETIVCSASGNL